METHGVSASSSPPAATQSLRQKPDADADDAAKVSSAQGTSVAKGSNSTVSKAGVETELAATQSVQEAKPTVNTSGQTTGTTINTTA